MRPITQIFLWYPKEFCGTRRTFHTPLQPDVNIITGFINQAGQFLDGGGPALVVEVNFTDTFEVAPAAVIAAQWAVEAAGTAGIIVSRLALRLGCFLPDLAADFPQGIISLFGGFRPQRRVFPGLRKGIIQSRLKYTALL
jgi:hypothetical protein